MTDKKKFSIVDNVTVLPVVTSHDIPTERVLTSALTSNLRRAIIIGEDENGDFYFASSSPDGPSVLWDLEMAKKKLLDIAS